MLISRSLRIDIERCKHGASVSTGHDHEMIKS
jgi:hypothetical protein